MRLILSALLSAQHLLPQLVEVFDGDSGVGLPACLGHYVGLKSAVELRARPHVG